MSMPKEKEWAENIFLQDKPAKLMIYLKEEEKPVYQSIVSKKIDSTYAHTLKILKSLNEMKLVKFEETGRIKLVKLTELGVEVANSLVSLFRLIELAEIEGKIEQIFLKEIKGKLRAEVDKEAIDKQFGKIKEKIKEYYEGYPQNISILARKLSKKVDSLVAEAIGIPPEVYIPLEE